jgi:uncharacterized membrane protein
MATRKRPPAIARLRSFSDAVLAIVLTLLVLELLPDVAQSPRALLDNWPSYLAYLTAFLTIGSVWVNHTEQMSRVRRANPVVMFLNLGVLLGASLVPWPTALISHALKDGTRADQIAAMVVFTLVACLLSVPWVALDLYLARRPQFLASPEDAPWMRRHALTSAATILTALVSLGIAFISPLVSLLIYLPVFAAFIVARLLERAPVEADDDE